MRNLKELSLFGYDTRESLRQLSSAFRLNALSVSQIRDPFVWSFIQNQPDITQLEIQEYIPSSPAQLDSTTLPNLMMLTSCPVGFIAFGPGRPITSAVIRACPKHTIDTSVLSDLISALNQTKLPLTRLDLNCEKWTGSTGWDFVIHLKSTSVCSTLTHLKITDTLMYFVARQHNNLDFLDSLLGLLEGYTSLLYFEVAEGAVRPSEPLGGCPDKQVVQLIVDYLRMAGKLREWKSKCPKLKTVRFFGQVLP
ncbi:hypothetical protein BDV93DRAFT_561255 [Ceratobasidium sp. AG-I]|nr:hypothetical protein BDV93DRAFT_561255 [Ceratobasidium sp. AG-I]